MNILIEDDSADEKTLLALIDQKKAVRENILDSAKQDSPEAIRHWADELKVINAHAGMIIMRTLEKQA